MMAKLLIIEDEPDIRETLSYNFKKEGFKVEVAANGSDALTLCKIFDPDVLILDLMLPDMSGLDVCKKIKNSIDFKDTSIIMLTAKGEEVDRILGFELGADDYVTKPFSVRELILRVKVILKKSSSLNGSDSRLSVGPLKLDFSAHEVSLNGVEIILTALEFKLLKHLAQRRGRVQTRDQLLGDVWGYSSEITTRTVDTHIKRLREKLGPDSDFIQTIRGVGYRLNISD